MREAKSTFKKTKVLLASSATVFYWLYLASPMCWEFYEGNLLLHMHSRRVEWMHRKHNNFRGYCKPPKDIETFCFSQMKSMTNSAWMFALKKEVKLPMTDWQVYYINYWFLKQTNEKDTLETTRSLFIWFHFHTDIMRIRNNIELQGYLFYKYLCDSVEESPHSQPG